MSTSSTANSSNDSTNTDASSSALISLLREQKQMHLIPLLEAASPATRQRLIQTLMNYPWEELSNSYKTPDLSRVSPCEVIKLNARPALNRELESIGTAAYAQGKVAVLMVAGGQGSRLGCPGAKGCYQLMPVSGRSMFQVHAEKVLALSRKFGREIIFLIMTSPATDCETRAYFEQQKYFGLKPSQVRYFCQGTVPTTDAQGKILLKSAEEFLENPDGHGGCLRALIKSGTVDFLTSQGVEDIVYIQVDNVLAPVLDCFAVGLRHKKDCDIVTKVMPKTDPDEKMGALVKIDGRDSIVEYSDLTPEQKRITSAEGDLLFGWGSPMMQILSVKFLARLAKEHFSLPFHLARKKVSAWIDGSQKEIESIKREKFFFDIIPFAHNVGLEIARLQEFAPVKNATGVDSVESARELISNEFARWLREVGLEVNVSNGDFIEICPLLAQDAQELAAKLQQPTGGFQLPRAILKSCYLRSGNH